MFSYEKLDSNNAEAFNTLLEESNKENFYKLDFYRNYNNKSFISKYFIRKLVKLIIYDNKYIGYIWYDFTNSKSYKINDMYLKKEYLYLLNNHCIKFFSNNVFIYEIFENEYTLSLLKKLNMNKYKNSLLMKLNYNNNINRNLTTNGILIPYKKKKDVKIRCAIQNSVFRDNNRIPLTTADIEFDENQDYFIDDLCLFISVDNKVIGYGQIIYNKGIYTVVNLGIIKEYRGKGYGRDLLNALIILAEKKGIRDLFIRVELNNHKAERLYESCGFNEVGYISNWIWTR